MIDHTHDPHARSWVAGAKCHRDFPVQNLPLGIFSTAGSPARAGMAIGDSILDLVAIADRLPVEATNSIIGQSTLNTLFAAPATSRAELRRAVFALLTDPAEESAVSPHLHPAARCQMHMPLTVRDYTDFYAGIHHARAVGAILRPDNPLLPNYKYVPVGYHGRASSIQVSGHEVVRPRGQIRDPQADAPHVQHSRRLDYEVELGIWISGQSAIGTPISLAAAEDHIAGICLLNDWSARDIQAWEYVPLGPFLAKNFATTISPWVVTAEALAPYTITQEPRPDGDPAPLPYLAHPDGTPGLNFDIEIEVALRTPAMVARGEPGHVLGRSAARHLYWTPAQLIAHHTVNGCDLGAGDLLGTGTISGPDDLSRGSLMELTAGGVRPVMLPDGEQRTFLADGDEVIMTAWAGRDDQVRLGLGECRAVVRAGV